MSTRPPFTEQEIEVLPALGRFEDFRAVVAPKSEGVHGCWCMAYRDSRVAAEQRPAVMSAACATPPGPGVLAYADGDVVGWCSVAPRSSYRRLMNSRTIPLLEGGDPWSIVCFVVRGGYRRRGLLHLLLAGAVAHAEAAGARLIEGYPVAGGGRVDSISGYVGSQELFEEAGFTVAATTTSRHAGRGRVLMHLEV